MPYDTADNADDICVVCFKNVNIYSVGNCDHKVCYECSTRMRVLCRQNECPICRQDLPKVIFSNSSKPFNEIANSAPYEDRKYKIQFQKRKIQDAFYKLLEHCCSLCPNRQFKTFVQLNDHMRREHELYYCDLCVEHLKIFSSERRCYNKNELGQHRQKGDPDDRSHRGHPLCEFCQVRFMDNDFLYRHLRKDHLFCHFCDADGLDLYYSSYDYLRYHFREEHYLCEEGTCVDEKFTPAFRTEIDLKAHKMSAHGRTMGKAAAKQARTLELEFTLKPRPRQQDSRKGKLAHADFDIAVEGAAGISEEAGPRLNSPSLDPSDFPSLPSGSGTVTVSSAPQRLGRPGALTIQAVGRRNAPLDMTDENFPVLGECNDNSQGTSVRLNINQERSSNVVRSGSIVTPRNVSIQVNHKQNGEQNIKIRQDDFPALSTNSGAQSLPAAKWVSVSHKKSVNTTAKEEKAVKQPLTDRDFPGLTSKFNANLSLKANEPVKTNYVNIRSGKEGKNAKKSTSVVIPVRDDWLDLTESSSLKAKSKKKKAKGNSVEEKSDTAKKKDDKDVTNPGKGKSESKKSQSSAFVESTSCPKLLKPLPTAEDWFGDSKKSQEKTGSEKCEVENEGVSRRKSKELTSNEKQAKIKSTKVKKIADVEENTLKSNDNSSIARKPESKAPPGFDQLNGVEKSNQKSKPPPGFTFDFPNSNGLTFTNSSGQSFAIPTSYSYTPPLNFERRNQTLVNKVFQILLHESSLDQFKRMSALFRQDMLSADEYCNHCIQTMGENSFREIFPELLILLPDISKQQELFQVFSGFPNFEEEKKQLQSCETCRQVLFKSDLKEHVAQHALQENFPLLMPNTWSR